MSLSKLVEQALRSYLALLAGNATAARDTTAARDASAFLSWTAGAWPPWASAAAVLPAFDSCAVALAALALRRGLRWPVARHTERAHRGAAGCVTGRRHPDSARD